VVGDWEVVAIEVEEAGILGFWEDLAGDCLGEGEMEDWNDGILEFWVVVEMVAAFNMFGSGSFFTGVTK
jgi:hypothetical protein